MLYKVTFVYVQFQILIQIQLLMIILHGDLEENLILIVMSVILTKMKDVLSKI